MKLIYSAGVLADRVAELLDHDALAGPAGVLLRVADRSGERAEHCAGHRQTHQSTGATPQPLPDPPPLTPDAVFDLASVTKIAATTAALLSLTDAGVLDPDQPARDWIPGLPAQTRLAHLLTHRAGLAEWWPLYAAGGRDPDSVEAVITGLPLRYPTGTARHYSDLGFVLLGRVVERAAGEPLAPAVRRLACLPAGMPTAHFRPGGAGPDLPLVATAHGDWYEQRMLATGEPYPVGIDPDSFAYWRSHTLLGEVHDGNAWHALGGVAGHAGLFGTAEDLVAYGRALLSSLAGTGPWRPETVRRFFAAGPDPGQGLGFWRWPERGAVGHAGFTGIRFAVLPGPGRIVVLLTNRVHTVRHELLDISGVWDRILADVLEGDR